MSELVSGTGASSFKSGKLFPGMTVGEWAPPEEGEEEAEVGHISFISSVGPGVIKIKMPEELMLPLAYQEH
jgi:hypothetical protein